MDIKIESVDRQALPQAIRWKIADWIAEDNLPEINRNLQEVNVKETFYSRYGKRLFDITLSLPAVIITLPINIVIGVITFFDVGRPIFFFQERIGKNGKIIKVVKFRNMRNTMDERGELLPASQRVTKWGKFVRKTSLDELLNFVSILKGDMSIIGPRPLVPQYMSRYSKRHLARCAVKPGLECPPRELTVSSRSWHDQFENDVWYVENLSFRTDCVMVINLMRFALNRKYIEIRGAAKRGDFMGYSADGRAINRAEVPESYIERALEELSEEIYLDKVGNKVLIKQHDVGDLRGKLNYEL